MNASAPNGILERTDVDVLVIGAGTSGSAAALFCAEHGMRVLCLERRPLDKAGARWVNGVAGWSFDAARLVRPTGPELAAPTTPTHLFAGHGPEQIVVDIDDMLEVDMRLLTARLQRSAQQAGAELVGRVRVESVDGEHVETSAGDVRARWIVDASGFGSSVTNGAGRVSQSDVCAAAQQTREIADMAGARAFFDERDVPMDRAVYFMGIAGGFSLVGLRVHGDHVGILCAGIPAQGHPSGTALLKQFIASNPWIGKKLFGGAGPIPLRRPVDRPAAGNVARIGDAAFHVFPAHGSGVGPGLIAARFLADSLADGRGVQGYAVAWQRRWGGLLATYDIFRRYSQDLSAEQIGRLMNLGLIEPYAARNALLQRFPRVKLATLPHKLRAAMSEPRIMVGFASVLARMAAVRGLYALYPNNPKRLLAWSVMVARLTGGEPDVT